MKNIQINKTQNLTSYTITQEVINDRNYIVVPVVMMTEGVRSGSKGAMLHTAANMAQYVKDWDGVSVTIYHPTNSEGNYISAKSPNVNIVGKIRNPKMNGNKLTGEAILDEQKLIAESPTAHQSIMAGTPLEVSIGAFTHELEMSGEYDGVQYNAVTQAYTPDHLAILPDQQGACSWNDGCGIRVNQNNKNQLKMNEEKIKELKEMQVNKIIELQINENGYKEKIEKVSRFVDGFDNQTSWHSLQEVYKDKFIYKRYPKNSSNVAEKLYEQSYTMSDTGEITLIGEPVEVIMKVEYIKMSTNTKNENKMSKKATVCQVNDLINNNQTNFTENDKEWLLSQDADTLSKMTPKVIEAPQVNEAEITDESVISFLAKKSNEEIIKLMPETLQANIKSGLELRDKQRAEMIDSIMTNSKDVWQKEELEAMNCNMLSKLSKTTGNANQIADYSANGGSARPKNENEVEPMLPTQI